MTWESGSEYIEVPVTNGSHLVLLGYQRIRFFTTSLYHQNDNLIAVVYADLPHDNAGQIKTWRAFAVHRPILHFILEMARQTLLKQMLG